MCIITRSLNLDFIQHHHTRTDTQMKIGLAHGITVFHEAMYLYTEDGQLHVHDWMYKGVYVMGRGVVLRLVGETKVTPYPPRGIGGFSLRAKGPMRNGGCGEKMRCLGHHRTWGG